jgi:hypothetical protein
VIVSLWPESDRPLESVFDPSGVKLISHYARDDPRLVFGGQ